MAKLTTMLQDRFLKRKEKPKEDEPERDLAVFSGQFRMGDFGEKERAELSHILEKYTQEESALDDDLDDLIAVTREVKAITNQAAILHGERIKRAQTILKKYREGAFTAWLMTTYGNRQTPYNFLQYFDFYSQVPQQLRAQVESMPRQAVYTLASRDGELEKKEEIVRNYKGETKQQMISLIRTTFPLNETDKRRENVGEGLIKALNRLIEAASSAHLSDDQKKLISQQLNTLKGLVK